ncbi:TonB-dependent receptor [Pseudochryseolinea flava]|uniref:SusC/RagA family TonB-linked outer membrane protein n=1 Tax=Pseudochryseolinea flava TaxID=2059302 RepID=A0A364Y037_9BACT|nr:TonB-dependent receptor [Pseudochryseolinea flava]RAV99246.1 SusC/RagA family TonB-linked outer membrane protein [Pseudochryseolinea flava]
MKKTLREHYWAPWKQKAGIQPITTMLALLFSTLSFFQIQAADTVPKAENISLGIVNTTLKDAMTILEKETPYRFFYNHRAVDVSKKVNVKLTGADIQQVVTALLKDTDFTFKIKGDQIVLRKKRSSSEAAILMASADGSIQLVEAPLEDSTIENYVIFAMTVSGEVKSETGEPLPGVSVLIKGTNLGTVTDADGKYTIDIPDAHAADGVLVFSFIGYVSQEVAISNRTNVSVNLVADIQTLSEVIVVGYGSKNKEDITSAVVSVNSADLQRVPGSTTSGLLAGKLPGVSFRMPDGRPGASAAIQIRNMGDPLFVIDGIQKDAGQFNNISPNDIESISILKDASASVYGSRAANGVVIVTTKKGTGAQGSHINVNSYYGWQNWVRFPKGVNAYEWMLGKADSEVNQTGATSITREELEKWRQGTEYGYKSFDWYDFIIKRNSPQYSLNINATGSTDKINYYLSFTKLKQVSVLGREFTFDRTNIQSNIDAKIAKRFKVGVQINGRVETRDNPGVPGVDDYWAPRFALFRNRPTERPYANDNPLYPNNIGHNAENWALQTKEISGYWREDWRVLQSNFTAEYETPIKGLTVKGIFSNYFADRLMNGHEYTYEVYTYDPNTDQYNVTGGSSNPWRERGANKVLENVTQGFINYDRSFGDHTIAATFVAERIDRREITTWTHTVPKTNVLPLLLFADMDRYEDTDREQARVGYVGRLSYNYRQKYYLEIAGRRDASFKFIEGKRWGTFPSVSGGWRISKEPFFEGLPGASVIDDLKLRASYGKLGDDGVALPDFAYITGYRYPTGPAILDGQVVTTAAQNRPVPITNISWFNANMTDIGLDFSLLNGKLSGSLDWFYRKRTGLTDSKREVVIPHELGYELPAENLNSDIQRGGEVALNYNGSYGDLTYRIGGNFSYSRRKDDYIYKERDQFGNSLQYYRDANTGRWTGIQWGYHVVGQFKSVEEINDYAVDIDGRGNTTLLPGDFIYEDVNGDGLINNYDERPIGYARGSTPIVNFGFSMSLMYKGFDFTADFSGGALSSYEQNWEMRWPYQNTGNLLRSMYDDRWHRADPLDPESPWVAGKNPALRFNDPNHSNYNKSSDWWMVNQRYIRLRTMELGYTVPTSLSERVRISKARVYVSTYNLFSIDNVKDYGIDPEIWDENGLQYPQNKIINVGFNLTF